MTATEIFSTTAMGGAFSTLGAAGSNTCGFTGTWNGIGNDANASNGGYVNSTSVGAACTINWAGRSLYAFLQSLPTYGYISVQTDGGPIYRIWAGCGAGTLTRRLLPIVRSLTDGNHQTVITVLHPAIGLSYNGSGIAINSFVAITGSVQEPMQGIAVCLGDSWSAGGLSFNASDNFVLLATQAMSEFKKRPIVPVFNKQLLTFTGGPTGGTFLLGYGGQITGNINYSSTPATLASNIQTALQALSTVGPGNLTVASGYDANRSFIISAANGFVAQAGIVTASSLTGGSSPNVGVGVTQVGGTSTTLLENPLVGAGYLLYQIAVPQTPEVLIIEFGQNDLGFMTAADFVRNCRAMLCYLEDTVDTIATSVIVCTPGFVGSDYHIQQYTDQNGNRLTNQILGSDDALEVAVAGTMNLTREFPWVKIADIYTSSMAKDELMTPNSSSSDVGLHGGDMHQELIAQEIVAAYLGAAPGFISIG